VIVVCFLSCLFCSVVLQWKQFPVIYASGNLCSTEMLANGCIITVVYVCSGNQLPSIMDVKVLLPEHVSVSMELVEM
jgi:hypothetical protein